MLETYEKPFTIRSSEVDIYGLCRPSALMGFLQDLATEHSQVLGIQQSYLTAEYHAAWILVRAWYRLDSPIRQDESVTIRTWHRGAGGMIVYRDFDIFRDGKPIGEAVTAWVVADVDSRKMLRPRSVQGIARSPVPETVKDRQLKLIRTPPFKKVIYDKTVRYSDLDLNGHMNNTRYADVAMDALKHEELRGKYLRELQINYSLECTAGETIAIARYNGEDGIYIDGCGEDGARRFESILQFAREFDGESAETP